MEEALGRKEVYIMARAWAICSSNTTYSVECAVYIHTYICDKQSASHYMGNTYQSAILVLVC